MWKHTSKNDYPNIILHDCFVTNISTQNNDIIFEFDDGFWITDTHKENPYGQILRTGKSQMLFSNVDYDFSGIYIFKELKVFKKLMFTNRVSLAMKDFIAKINSGKWSFEIKDELYAWHQAVFVGDVRFNHRPYRREFQIDLNVKEMIYSWNEIREDRVW